MQTVTAYIEWDPTTKLYVGIIPGMPGGHTQAASLDELHENLQDVAALCLQEESDLLLPELRPRFVGVQQIQVA